jgi:hypothetical protein
MAQWGYKGHAISEFPVLYWITGKLYRIFGYHEAIARLVTYAVFLIGLIFLFELGLRLFKNKWHAFIPVLLIYSSPFLFYYALNFLPNIPAFGLTLASWFYFFKYLTTRKSIDFVWCSLLSLLAALLKPIEIFNYLIMFGLLFLEYLRWFGLHRFNYSKEEIRNILYIFIGVIYGTYLWINYGQGYANSFGYHGNLLGILPIWGMNEGYITETLAIIKNKWMFQLFWPPVFYLIIVLFILNIVFYKRINRYLFLAIIFSLLGQLAYSILFFETFYHHDYYMINIVIFPTLLVIGSIQVWESFTLPKLFTIATYTIIVAFLFMTLKHSRFIIQERYYGKLQEDINPKLQTVTPYLRSIGITKDDLVISVPDPSPNISLYLMNQKGSTEAFVYTDAQLKGFVNEGAKYLIVNKQIDKHPEWYESYMKNQIGVYKGIKIYKIE